MKEMMMNHEKETVEQKQSNANSIKQLTEKLKAVCIMYLYSNLYENHIVHIYIFIYIYIYKLLLTFILE